MLPSRDAVCGNPSDVTGGMYNLNQFEVFIEEAKELDMTGSSGSWDSCECCRIVLRLNLDWTVDVGRWTEPRCSFTFFGAWQR